MIQYMLGICWTSLDPTISLWILIGCHSLLLDTFGRSLSQPNDRSLSLVQFDQQCSDRPWVLISLGRMPQSIAEHIWVVPEPNQVMVPEPCSVCNCVQAYSCYWFRALTALPESYNDKNLEVQNFWDQQKISDLW
jgi:hypothetical protein